MRDEIDKLKKHNMEDVKHHIIETLKRILEHRFGILKEKINGVHENFSNMIKALEQINNNSPILEELQKRWNPTFHILTTLCKATHKDLEAPSRLKPTQEM